MGVHQPAGAVRRGHVGDLVGLVGDVADQFLGDVLVGDDAGDPAVLVEDDRELVVPLAHPLDRVGQRQHLGEQQRLPGHPARRGGGQRGLGQVHQLPDADHAGDVVGVVAEDRVGGVAVAGDQVDRLGGRGVVPHEDGVGPGHQHLLEGALGELQGVVEQEGGVPRQLALLVGLADQVAQFLQGRAVVQLLDRLDADLAQQPVGGAVEDPHQRADDLEVEQGGGGEGLRQPFGDGEGEVLRRQLAQDHLDGGGEDEGEDHRDAGHGRVRDADAGQDRTEQRGDGRLGEEADDQAGDGDAELGSGEHERQAFQHLQGAFRALVALFGLAGQLEPVGGDVGEFLGDEVAGAGGQDEDGQQAESGTHRTPPRRVP